MTARFTSMKTASARCSSMAVACTSAPLIPLLDTALQLAVSICVAVRVILPQRV